MVSNKRRMWKLERIYEWHIFLSVFVVRLFCLREVNRGLLLIIWFFFKCAIRLIAEPEIEPLVVPFYHRGMDSILAIGWGKLSIILSLAFVKNLFILWQSKISNLICLSYQWMVPICNPKNCTSHCWWPNRLFRPKTTI